MRNLFRNIERSLSSYLPQWYFLRAKKKRGRDLIRSLALSNFRCWKTPRMLATCDILNSIWEKKLKWKLTWLCVLNGKVVNFRSESVMLSLFGKSFTQSNFTTFPLYSFERRDSGRFECLSISLVTMQESYDVIRFLFIHDVNREKKRQDGMKRSKIVWREKWWATFNSFKNWMRTMMDGSGGLGKKENHFNFFFQSSSLVWCIFREILNSLLTKSSLVKK